jgi:anti-sigma B factor antagonist
MADLGSFEHGALAVDERDESGTAVIGLSGDLDMTSIKQARAAIDAALATRPGRVILDASGLDYMDSSGIALLVQVTRMAQQVQVRNPTPIVRQLIELTGLSEILLITAAGQQLLWPRAADRGQPRRRLGHHPGTPRPGQKHLVHDRHTISCHACQCLRAAQDDETMMFAYHRRTRR